jgi:hypothetical protein
MIRAGSAPEPDDPPKHGSDLRADQFGPQEIGIAMEIGVVTASGRSPWSAR